jgi:AmmeMemoRadiSam system protein B
MEAIRAPAVAGTFYPADPDRLRAAVEGYLAVARAPAGPAPKAVIAPHADYVYSGPVAGHAFAALGAAAARIERVVVIGPAHFVPFRGIAVPSAGAFATPLGAVALDRAALGSIRGMAPVVCAAAPHRREHALEVELPFLQVLLGEFTLVPLVVGDARPAEVAELLAIGGLLQRAASAGPGAMRLDLRNSGDTAGARDAVVGYGAWAFRAV